MFIRSLTTLALILVTHSSLGDIIVTSTADSGAGTLRQALADVTEGETIQLAPGLAGETITLTTGELIVNTTTSIVGPTDLIEITIDGENNSRIFQTAAGTTTDLTGFNLTNGTSLAGGAILAFGSLNVNRCIFESNSSAEHGGAIFAGSRCMLTVVESVFASNASGRKGGAIYNSGAATITASSFSTNSSSRGGGAVFNESQLRADRCTFLENEAIQGGAIFNAGRTFFVSSLATTNNASDKGGAFYNEDSFRIIQSTVLANTVDAEGEGSEIYSQFEIVKFFNSIVIDSGENAFIGRDPDISNSFTEGDPQLAALGDFGGPTLSRPPLNGSPVIDMGDPQYFTETIDQTGRRRISGAGLDIGAVENHDFADNLVATFNDDTDGDGTLDGIEIAQGRDPNTADPDSDSILRLIGTEQISFGYSSATRNDMIVRLVKSSDLNGFPEVLLTDEVEAFTTTNDLVTFDLGAAGQRKAFYRLEVIPK